MTDLTAPEPNIPLLRKAVEWAEAEAAKTDGTGLWNQDNWMEQTDCGTSYCIAGYTVAIAGHTIGAEAKPCAMGCCSELSVDGEPASWTDTGATLLGIDATTACRLFSADNDITDVRRFAEQIAARAGERL